jgi:metallophosphoesterase (TIGR03767 family)
MEEVSISASVRTTSRRALIMALFLAALLISALAVGLAWANNPQGKTTAQQRIVPASNDPGFRQLKLGPGEGRLVRQGGVGIAKPGRAARRSSLVYFGQLSDFQLADEESPARVEFVDPAGSPVDAAWRPQEALQPQVDNAMVRQINAFAAASPTANGNGTRRRMDLVLGTGDLIDNQQFNETRWVRTILEGGRFNPGSGVDPATSGNPACAALKPAIVDASNPGRYTGVQDYDDYAEGPDPQFYDPDQPTGQWSDWPSYTGMMDAAQRPFTADGLNVPSYLAFGNHDALVQGNQAASHAFEQVATGCIKPLTGSGGTSIGDALSNLSPAVLQGLAPNDRMLVPPDPTRRFVSKKQYKSVFQSGGQPDGHGFDFVDPAQNAASGGAAGYYSWSPVPRVRFISLDTTCEGGVAGPSADGNIDDPQFRWLKGKLQRAQADGRLVVLFSHHAIQSLTCNVPDEAAPPCTGPDSHGHDANPGCDVDPRSSKPIHLGADVTALLHQYPNAVAWVAGHSHVNDVTPYPDGNGGGFWMIRTAAEADWPQQSRLVELFDNHDGTLSIFGTILDHASNATAPTAISNLANPDPFELASIGRTLSYNDPQVGARACSPNPCGEGAPKDRNVELLVKNPLAP